jgi:predicted phosphoadenosine phosphosulfate sulfurtransferase
LAKRGLGKDVLIAAMDRIKLAFDDFPRIYVSFSGGKDSSVMLHLVMAEAIRRGRKVGVLFVDLEAQYQLTIKHVELMFKQYAEHIDPYWVALPIALRNAVSNYEPKWLCWDPEKHAGWVRQPSSLSITSESTFPFFCSGMEFEEFIDDFSHWYSNGEATCCFVGIRADESLNRYRTLILRKRRYKNLAWTTWKGGSVFNAYPIYDWRTEDLWTFAAKFGAEYNKLYDRMHHAGLSIHQMRICQPYGDDQRRGLWLYHVIEPETWGRVVARVNGANSGALYAQESGNILGRIKISKPDSHSWESFSRLLLDTLPPHTKEHYENKIAVFLKWYSVRGYPAGIPDSGPANAKDKPSWTRICKMLLRNDHWAKGLSFTQTKSQSYERYKKIMKKRRTLWGM